MSEPEGFCKHCGIPFSYMTTAATEYERYCSRSCQEAAAEQEAAAAREQRQAAFVAEARRMAAQYGWWNLVSGISELLVPYAVSSPWEQDVAEFAEAEGWPGVLRAIAQAMEEDERERKELVDRR